MTPSIQEDLMKRLILALTITVAFLVGCITATVATQLVVPPIKAGTNPKKWEYTCFKEPFTDAKATSQANKHGSEGWELVSVTPVSGSISALMGWCYKRPLP